MAQACNQCSRRPDTTCSSDSDQTWKRLETWAGSCYRHFSEPVVSRDTTVANRPSPENALHLAGTTQKICDSICFDSLTDEHCARSHGVPPYVIGLAVMTIANARKPTKAQETRFMCQKPLRFSWHCDTAYLNFYDRMLSFVKQQKPLSKRSYLKVARVRLLQWTGEDFELSQSCVIENRDDWIRRVPSMIANYCGSKTGHLFPFYLEIQSEFEFFNLTSYTPADIRKILDQTEFKNFEKHPYWSRKFLKQMFNRTTVSKIVESYRAAQAEPPNRRRSYELTNDNSEQFVDWIFPERIRLFATCIRSKISVNVLHKLMCQRRDDIKDCLIPLEKETLDTFLRSEHANRFRTNQMGFRPHNFPDPEPEFGDEDIEDDATKTDRLIPINYDKTQWIGRGGFGIVYKASIHPDFHAFSSVSCFQAVKAIPIIDWFQNREEEFALKIIGDSVHQPASNEVKAWQLVVKIPHPHITPLFASWLQSNQCFMLSPLADDSLDKFLSRGRAFNVEKETEWLLEQVEGLVAAIHHIHHIGRIALGNPKGLKRLERFDCGYHHDLKPANILIFGRILKISDFGTAKIHQLVSGKPQPVSLYTDGYAGGDSEYGGPDRHLHSRVGRSYDIWSFGCILLEILLWAFGRGGKHLEDFHNARKNDACNDCRCTVPDSFEITTKPIVCLDGSSGCGDGRGGSEFWYKCSKRPEKFHLKSCVIENLEWVITEAKRYEKEHELLTDLARYVASMLQVEPGQRPTASNIKDRVGELRFRANFYFRHKSSKLEVEILTQPDTCRDPVSPRHTTPSPSEDFSRTNTYYEDQPVPVSRKRKADDLDELATSALPPTSIGMPYIGDHLTVPISAYNTSRLSQPRTLPEIHHASKKPRLQVPIPGTVNQDSAAHTAAPNNTRVSPVTPSHEVTLEQQFDISSSVISQARESTKAVEESLPEDLIKKLDDSPLVEKLAKDIPPSKSNSSRSRTL